MFLDEISNAIQNDIGKKSKLWMFYQKASYNRIFG
jgi:hypothetical protein